MPLLPQKIYNAGHEEGHAVNHYSSPAFPVMKQLSEIFFFRLDNSVNEIWNRTRFHFQARTRASGLASSPSPATPATSSGRTPWKWWLDFPRACPRNSGKRCDNTSTFIPVFCCIRKTDFMLFYSTCSHLKSAYLAEAQKAPLMFML